MDGGIFEAIGIRIDLVVLIIFIIMIIQLVWTISLVSRTKKLNKRISHFTKGKNASNLEEIMVKRFSEMRQVVKNEKVQNQEIQIINDKFKTTFCKIGLVKYDAFKEMSGKLSFSLALLTESYDGIIITSMHSREGCYTYCKEVVNEESYYVLSEEERLALNVAMGRTGAKEAARAKEDEMPDITY